MSDCFPHKYAATLHKSWLEHHILNVISFHKYKFTSYHVQGLLGYFGPQFNHLLKSPIKCYITMLSPKYEFLRNVSFSILLKIARWDITGIERTFVLKVDSEVGGG